MNILFLVMQFLLLFSWTTSLLIQHVHFFSKEALFFQNYELALLSLETKFEKHKCKSKKPPVQKTAEKLLPKAYYSPRLRTNLSKKGKWNLACKTPLFTKITSDLLESLYGHATFWKEAQEKTPDLATQLLSEFDLNQGLISNNHHLVLYKMLKGSPFGTSPHPPLEKLFYFDSKEKKATTFSATSDLILLGLFGAAIGAEVIELENERSRALSKEEFFSLITKSSFTLKEIRVQEIEELFHFTPALLKKEKIFYEDPSSKISVQIRL